MSVNVFPPVSGGGGGATDFVVDMNDTINNVATLPNAYVAGAYSMVLSSGDSAFDVYFLDANSLLVGYSSENSIVATAPFVTVVALGTSNTEVITFTYSGSVSNASGEGNQATAGAYIDAVSVIDLPSQNETTVITGGNFSPDVELYFVSGETSLAAKTILVNSVRQLTVTRPDNLSANLSPWTLRVENAGVPQPTGSNENLFTGITAGSLPVWVTTSLPGGTFGEAYTATLEATDVDGPVTYALLTGTLPPGLTLDPATGVISGTPSGSGSASIIFRASDDGNSYADKDLGLSVLLATGGTVSFSGGYTYHTFTSTGTFTALAAMDCEYVILGGGGGGGGGFYNASNAGGGGGAGGLRSSMTDFIATGGGAGGYEAAFSVTAQSYSVQVGPGGDPGTTNAPNYPSSSGGGSSVFGISATGGGRGGGGREGYYGPGQGGSGGGNRTGGDGSASGTAGQGTAGSGSPTFNGTGGGTYAVGTTSGNANGGLGVLSFNVPGIGNTSFGRGGGSSNAGNVQGQFLGGFGCGGGGAGYNGGGNGNYYAGASGTSGFVLIRY